MKINGYKISPKADLSWASLSGANLSGANLSGANLSGANLRGADLSRASLSSADLRGANLRGADLSGANLSGANLSGADLSWANLSGANLSGANLSGADLRGAKNVPTLPHTIITPEGDLVVYKKLQEGVATLLIPKEAKRCSATGRKCRAEFALVQELPKGITVGHSRHDPLFLYIRGQTVRPTEPFDENRWNECAPGIHFFLTREEAENY